MPSMAVQCSYCLGRPCPGPTAACAWLLPSMVTAAAPPLACSRLFTRLLLAWVPLREMTTSVRMDLLKQNPRIRAISQKGLLNKASFIQNGVLADIGRFSRKTA